MKNKSKNMIFMMIKMSFNEISCLNSNIIINKLMNLNVEREVEKQNENRINNKHKKRKLTVLNRNTNYNV